MVSWVEIVIVGCVVDLMEMLINGAGSMWSNEFYFLDGTEATLNLASIIADQWGILENNQQPNDKNVPKYVLQIYYTWKNCCPA